MFRLGKGRLQGELYSTFQYLSRAYKKASKGHVRTGQEKLKLKEGRIGLNIRKKFLAVRVLRYRNRLSRKAGDSLCLEVFKTGLNGALSNLTS